MAGSVQGDPLRFIAIVLLVLFAFVFPWRQVAETSIGVSIAPIIAVLLGFVWLLSVLRDGQFRKPHRIHGVFAVFTFYIALSYFWSIDPGRTIGQSIVFAYIFGLLVIFWDVLRERRAVEVVIQAFIIGVFVIGIVGVWHLIEQGHLGDRETVGHGVNANQLARWIALTVPLASALVTKSDRFSSGVFGAVNWAFLALMPFMIIATGSRQGLVAVGAFVVIGVFGVFNMWKSSSISLRIPILVVLATAVVLVWTAIQGLLSLLLSPLLKRGTFDATLGNRVAIWEAGASAFREQPIIGLGAGTYEAISQEGISGGPYQSHNVYLGVATELGLLGLAIFLVLVLAPLVTVLRRPGPKYSSVSLFVALGLFSLIETLYPDPFMWVVVMFALLLHSDQDVTYVDVPGLRRLRRLPTRETGERGDT